MLNRYWFVTKNNEVLFYKNKSPQCNIDHRILEHSIKNSEYSSDLRIEKIPVAYNSSDWLTSLLLNKDKPTINRFTFDAWIDHHHPMAEKELRNMEQFYTLLHCGRISSHENNTHDQKIRIIIEMEDE